MSLLPDEQKSAIELLESGATVGMVRNDLRGQGVASAPREETLARAAKVVNRRFRAKHLVVALVGTVVLGAGVCWYRWLAANRVIRVGPPGFVMPAGLIATPHGVYNATQNKIDIKKINL